MIVVTGGEGFIGKNLVSKLRVQQEGIVVSLDTKSKTLGEIYWWFSENSRTIDVVYHLGAITDTTEMNIVKFDEYNVNMSIFIWNLCSNYEIPLIYASSAATYGNGSQGFNDENSVRTLQPLNPYGWSKQQIDIWTNEQERFE